MIITKGSKIYDDQNSTYVVEELIGNGGFSKVFRIKKEENGEYYALKSFSSEFENEDELNSFRNEISKAMQVKNENVVEYKFFNDGEKIPELPPYIIMEYCNGGSLENYIKNVLESGQGLSNEEIKNILLQLIDGMEKINEKVVHRDIKLQNILLTNGIIKISDFGISKNIDDSTRTMTFKGYGTKEYIAPEAWRMEKNTKKMDIYSMGIVFYQVVTLSRYPYDIKNGKIEEYRNAHLYGSVIRPSKYNSNLELTIETIILKMLEKEPNKRFDDWREIRDLINIEVPNKNSRAILDKIIKKRILIDEENRKVKIEETKKLEAINEKKKLISYSVYTNLYQPIKEFVDDFNKLYASGKMWISDYNVSVNRMNEVNVTTLSSKKIHVIIKSIIDEVFEEELRDPFLGNYYKKTYRPKLQDKEILAWGAIYFDNQMSYNLVLVEDEESMYGKWYQIKNRNNALYRTPRLPEPFAFEFNEIEDELGKINAMHIYTSNVEMLNIDELLGNFEKII